jgi:hypothetical protein
MLWVNRFVHRIRQLVGPTCRPGGWWALVWNVLGDSIRLDPFHEATKALLPAPLSPSAGPRDIPFAVDAEARMAAMEQIGAFDAIEHQASAWSLVLDPEQTVALYAIFSNINIRADRAAILGGIRSHRARRLPRQRNPQYDRHTLHRTLHWATT